MSLKSYLRLAYKEAHLSWEAVLSTVDQLEVTLRLDCENLILVFGGSFNPPHQGHIDVLLSGMRPEVDALATVILPCEDYLLWNKMGGRHSDFLLDMHQRANIWTALPLVPKDKTWVWASTYLPFQHFTDALVRLTRADGYRLAFQHIIGPDLLRPWDPLVVIPYVSSRILVSNRARHVAEHFLPNGKPVIWNGFGEWSSCKYSSSADRSSGDGQEAVLWSCCGAAGSEDPNKKGYYLQFANPRPIDINSTSFREALLASGQLRGRTLNELSTPALLDILALALNGGSDVTDQPDARTHHFFGSVAQADI